VLGPECRCASRSTGLCALAVWLALLGELNPRDRPVRDTGGMPDDAPRNWADRVRSLPSDAFVPRTGLDFPYPEVAPGLAITKGTARARVARGLSRLLDNLEMP
jgi:hypothetical protein